MKSKLKSELKNVEEEIRKKTVGYIVTALGLVAGLAWNDAVKALIEYFFPAEQNSLQAKLIYAVLITIVVVLASVYLAKIFKKEELEEKKKGKKAEE